MFHFVANLKPYTLPEVSGDERFDAYLLSADYTSGLAELAAVVRAEERSLVADNGNMDTLRSIGSEFAADAAKLDEARTTWEKARGHYARPQELPKNLRDDFRALAHKIAARSESITTDVFARDAVRRQASIDPTWLVGMEDLTLATMGGLNLEPEYSDLPGSFFEQRVHRAVTFARRTIDGEFGDIQGKVLAGLHALDYDSGVLAGRLAAESGLDGVTVGMFGALTDRNYVDFRVEDGEIIELATSVPRPYLRVIETAAGVLEGFRRAGRPRPAFHALGVGTPILLPLLSLLGQGEQYFATDSTAPIVDGWSSPTISLYVTDPAPLKYKAYRIADVWIRGGRGWDCECPYCSGFREAHPPEIGQAQKWWRAQGKPDIKKEMLERNGPLSAWLPFLGYSADDDLRREAGLARVGHNHWVLQGLEREIRSRSQKWTDLLAWVEGTVDAYQQASGSVSWKAAVSEAFTLARATGGRLAASASAGDPVNVRGPGDDKHDYGDQASGKAPPHFLMGYGEPLIGQESPRALLRAALEQLRQTETVALAWEQLQPLAVGLAGHASMILHVLRANTMEVRERVAIHTPYVEAWRAALTDTGNANPKNVQTVRENLLAAASKDLSAAEAEVQVDALLHGDAPLFRADKLMERAATSAQSSFVGMYAAATAASFRLSCLGAYIAAAPSNEGTGEAPSPTEVTEWLMSWAPSAAQFVENGFSQFYELLTSDDPSPADAQALAQAILAEGRPRGLSAAKVLGALSRQGIQPDLLTELGPVVLSLAESNTRLQLLVAYAAHVLANAHSLDADSWLESERKAALRDFASKVPVGKQPRIDELGDLDEGVLVEVQGRIETLVIEHDPKPPKFSSFVVLRAFDGAASVRLRAHMFSLARNGLVEGACCKVRGFVRRQRPWLAKNETGLDIDRVSLSQLRKVSWLDDVAYRMRPFFRLYQDEMNLFNTPGGV